MYMVSYKKISSQNKGPVRFSHTIKSLLNCTLYPILKEQFIRLRVLNTACGRSYTYVSYSMNFGQWNIMIVFLTNATFGGTSINQSITHRSAYFGRKSCSLFCTYDNFFHMIDVLVYCL